MFTSLKHPRFFIPFLLLTFLISLFVMVENHAEANIHALQKIYSEEITQIAGRLQSSNIDFNAERAVIDKLFANIGQEQTQRGVLFVLIFLSSMSLLGFLLCNARCYQRNLKQVETAEHYSALFAEALQSTRVGVMIRNMREPEQPVVFVNKAFCLLTGYDQVLMGIQKSDVLFGWHTDRDAVAAFREAVSRGESATFDLLIYRKDGSSFWSEWHVSPVEDGHGRLTHYVSILTDISDLKETQEALSLAKEQAERACMVKSNFLATMSHEIRTPLNGLLGVLDLLRDSPLNQDQGMLLEVALNSGHSLHEIINDILDYAKIEAGKVSVDAEPFSLRELLKNAIDLTRPVADSRKLDLRLEYQEDLPDRLTSDAGRIRQILLNLITNAIKYTEQGSITVRVSHLLSQTSADRFIALLRFEVIDTGIGISAADQDQLFEEFSRVEHSYSRRFSGTGLGLAISRRLVKLMNGEIGVESRLGQGSRFWFMLPLPVDPMSEPNEVKPMTAESKAPQHVSRSHRLLLVEDSETNRLIASRYLDKAGYKHDVAVTGAEAVSIARARAYDLILMDISMPDMDGMEATRRIRDLGGWAMAVPIVALTAHVMQGDRERFLAAGMNDHLAKPINYDLLVRTLEVWLKNQPLADDSGRSMGDAPSSKTPAGPLPEMDPAVLQHLVDNLGADSVLRITQVFLEDFPRRLEAFKPDGEAPAMLKIGHAAHTLKSSSANCGLMSFSGLMADLEYAVLKGDRERVAILLQNIDPACRAARQALEAARGLYAAG